MLATCRKYLCLPLEFMLWGRLAGYICAPLGALGGLLFPCNFLSCTTDQLVLVAFVPTSLYRHARPGVCQRLSGKPDKAKPGSAAKKQVEQQPKRPAYRSKLDSGQPLELLIAKT